MIRFGIAGGLALAIWAELLTIAVKRSSDLNVLIPELERWARGQ